MKALRGFAWLCCLLLLTAGVCDVTGVVDVKQYASTAWEWVRPTSGPVTQVVVVEESKNRPPAVAAVVLGKTSDELRAAKKWKLYDKDNLPDTVKPAVEKLLETNPVPFVLLFHGSAYTVKPLPATDADFAALLKSQGGIQ